MRMMLQYSPNVTGIEMQTSLSRREITPQRDGRSLLRTTEVAPVHALAPPLLHRASR